MPPRSMKFNSKTPPPIVWTNEMEDELISLYEGEEFLYNLEKRDYANQDKRRRTYEHFGRILGVTSNAVFRRLRTLRTQYTRDFNRLKSQKPGSVVKKLTPRSRYLQEKLAFLRTHLRTRNAVSPLHTNQEDSWDKEEYFSDLEGRGEEGDGGQSDPYYDDAETQQNGPVHAMHEQHDDNHDNEPLHHFSHATDQSVFPDDGTEGTDGVHSFLEEDRKMMLLPSTSGVSFEGGAPNNYDRWERKELSRRRKRSQAAVFANNSENSEEEDVKPTVSKRKKVTEQNDPTFKERMDILSSISKAMTNTLTNEVDEPGLWSKIAAQKLRRIPEVNRRFKMMHHIDFLLNEAIDGNWHIPEVKTEPCSLPQYHVIGEIRSNAEERMALAQNNT